MGKWGRALIVGAVLIATHVASAVFYANRYANGGIRTPTRAMTLDLTFDEWSVAAVGADSTTYLNVAQNVAAGKGVVATYPGTNPPQTAPFLFWGPGTPVVLGWWLKLVGGRTMFTFFLFAAAAQFVAGALAVATAAQWTRSTIALSLVAFCSGYCPPVQDWFYGVALTSSEIVALPMLALLFFALSKAFLAWGDRGANDARRGGAIDSGANCRARAIWRRLIPDDLNRQVWLWFAFAGVLIGSASLSRDCVRVFAPFVAAYLIARTVAFDRRRIWAAIAIGGVLLAGNHAVRYPVQVWNKYRAAQHGLCYQRRMHLALWTVDEARRCGVVQIGRHWFRRILGPGRGRSRECLLSVGQEARGFVLADAAPAGHLEAAARCAGVQDRAAAGSVAGNPRMAPFRADASVDVVHCDVLDPGDLLRRAAIASASHSRSVVLVFVAHFLRFGSDPFRVSIYVSDLEYADHGSGTAVHGVDAQRMAVGARRCWAGGFAALGRCRTIAGGNGRIATFVRETTNEHENRTGQAERAVEPAIVAGAIVWRGRRERTVCGSGGTQRQRRWIIEPLPATHGKSVPAANVVVGGSVDRASLLAAVAAPYVRVIGGA